MTQADDNPHALVYSEFEEVDGVTLGTHWRIHDWSLEMGAYGPPLTEARISEISFIDLEPRHFEKPEGAREASMPEEEGEEG